MMMEYKYRRKAYARLSQQREDVLKELKEEYRSKKPTRLDRFFIHFKIKGREY
ncbi:hypothetical protein EV207_1145 [Scopulibacillus darangshiensis]|uniref:Uncharacterized protein n=1 Tax=Scopulibacillus darangshiensis TaxID=442528 RepID=A0A4R2P2E0_9BACL|nr:hypothetical protein [Scopulibacillus darangshiensis]TCP28883.1 hypothetical protein EV207_1145 [Scopulibacillus darangshiensis]